MLGKDATERRIGIPPKFIPYLETHRIYELFHEIAGQLIIKQPADHILYMKQCLPHARRSRDSPRIILLCPEDFDGKLLAEYLDLKMGIKAFGLADLEPFKSSEEFALNVRRILRKLYFEESGWVFIDFPRTRSEARALQSLGIIPTHVFEILWTEHPTGDTSPSTPSESGPSESSHEKTHLKDLRNLQDLREIYSSGLIGVETAGRTYGELGRACMTLARRRKYRTPCYNFRVVLLGPPGSGRRSVAKYLSERYNLVSIDFDYLLKQTRLQSGALGEALRCFDRWGIRVRSDVKIKVIESKLMSAECLKKGWVLFGHPMTVEDFRLLDSLATPPNRIVCIDVDEATCRQRLFSKGFNVVTGSECDLEEGEGETTEEEGASHIADYEILVDQSLTEYFTNVESLLSYAGESAMMVDGAVSKRSVKEMVESCLYRAPSAPPRIGKKREEVKPGNIEFEPDDPTDTKIYEHLRKPESILSLV